jgi:uncharacterized protein (DUF433 family)
MKWQDRIVIDPDVLVGKPVVKGTRIAVELVIDLLGRGYTTNQVLRQYDHLTNEDVRACLAYSPMKRRTLHAAVLGFRERVRCGFGVATAPGTSLAAGLPWRRVTIRFP